MKLVHTPGETDDQLYVWLPEKRVLMPGDNFYRAFPNLYAIRGTPYRDVRKWISSLDEMIAEWAEGYHELDDLDPDEELEGDPDGDAGAPSDG